jgi:adenylate kinase family enzyme
MSLLSAQQSHPYSKKITQQLLDSRRVAIIGNQGAGKTTLANTLAKMIGIDFVEVPWVNGITQPEKEEIKRQMAKRENWIVDGDFGFLDMADTVIRLDFPLSLCLWRTTTRSIKRFLRSFLNRPRSWSFSCHRLSCRHNRVTYRRRERSLPGP